MARKFSDLRQNKGTPIESLKSKAAKAFAEVATLPYGADIRAWLLAELARIDSPESEGAWRDFEARRKMAAELLDMMETNDAQSTRRTDRSDTR